MMHGVLVGGDLKGAGWTGVEQRCKYFFDEMPLVTRT